LPASTPPVGAKQATTLDALSGGRLALGAGIGWSREGFDAPGVPVRAARGAHCGVQEEPRTTEEGLPAVLRDHEN
jgi:alkanesulfonate monooxygenase SsuD/methylene tetrahydromethanopterin reductase-like flavin-dependent oxidoreductase (luciferase family)